ncbi:MAG: modA, partial [Chloroflexi bacterium]|nr:modA [Chloroflexota bacterium]
MRKPIRGLLISLPALVGLALVSSGGQTRAAYTPSRAGDNGTLTVFAAASLTEAFNNIGSTFAKANNVSVHFNFAGSDALVTQLGQGAPADVFASANQTQMNIAIQKGLIRS